MTYAPGIGQMKINNTNFTTHSAEASAGITHLVWVSNYLSESKKLVVHLFTEKNSQENYNLFCEIFDIRDRGLLAVITSLKNSNEYSILTSKDIKSLLPKEDKINVFLEHNNEQYPLNFICSSKEYTQKQVVAVEGLACGWHEQMLSIFKSKGLQQKSDSSKEANTPNNTQSIASKHCDNQPYTQENHSNENPYKAEMETKSKKHHRSCGLSSLMNSLNFFMKV